MGARTALQHRLNCLHVYSMLVPWTGKSVARKIAKYWSGSWIYRRMLYPGHGYGNGQC